MAGRPDRVERLTNLLALLLETPRPLSLVEIAAALDGQYAAGEGARRAAFERDKAALREIGVPIETEVLAGNQAGVTVYRIDRDRYELAGLDLDPDEARALQVAFAAVRSTSGDGFAAGQDALLKLGADGAADAAELAGGTMVVTAALPDLPALPLLREAAAQRYPVSFGYRERPRIVDPYGLLLRKGFWYVFGRDHDHDERRTFRVDRIEGTVTAAGVPGSFERPADFDPRAALSTDAGRFGAFDGATDEVPTAQVWIAADRAALVEREVGSERVIERHDDRSIVVSVPCVNVGAFGSWVLGMVDRAEVLGPPEVRAAVVARLAAIASSPGADRR